MCTTVLHMKLSLKTAFSVGRNTVFNMLKYKHLKGSVLDNSFKVFVKILFYFSSEFQRARFVNPWHAE